MPRKTIAIVSILAFAAILLVFFMPHKSKDVTIAGHERTQIYYSGSEHDGVRASVSELNYDTSSLSINLIGMSGCEWICDGKRFKGCFRETSVNQYRETDGSVKEIFTSRIPYTTNWITFYSE